MAEIDVDKLIVAELKRISPATGFEGSDWQTVLALAGGRRFWHGSTRRRIALGFVAVVLVVLLAAPALGLTPHFLDFLSSDKAPTRVVRQFATFNVTAPRGMGPNVIAGQTRRLAVYRTLDGKNFPLFVAPRRNGGFCFLFGYGGGCTERTVPSHDQEGDNNAAAIGLSRLGSHVLAGHVFDKRIANLIVHYNDGQESPLPLLWVGAPIDAGFFFYDVPWGHRNNSRGPVAVVARDLDGKEIARLASLFKPPPPWFNPKLVADLSRKHVILRSGKLSIAIAPARTGGHCWWLRASYSTIGSGCAPPRTINVPVAGGLNHSGDSKHGGEFTVYSAQVKPAVARVELRFENGESVSLTPVEGHVLYNIPSQHWPRGTRLRLALAYGHGGAILNRQRFDTVQTGLYACARPMPIGAGLKTCP